MNNFSGKTAIVTGAGCGIGLEICRQLCAGGARVVLNDIDPRLALAAATSLNSNFPGQCISFTGDAGSVDVIDQLVQAAITSFGQIDIVVANAGITVFGDFFSCQPEDLSKLLQLNLAGSFFLTQRAAQQMKKTGGGAILLMSSVTAHQAHKDLAAYAMSKAALEMLARNLVIELSPFHITINAIAPGATMTERTAADAAYLDTWSKLTPAGRPASVEDIAGAALFLVSPAARHITGQTLIVDGGWTCLSPQP